MTSIEKMAERLAQANWKAIDGKDLQTLMEGKKIIGAEPIDYPLTDGVILYLTGDDKELTAVEIGIDPFEKDIDFYIMSASIAF